jgi:protein subunit release factor A
LARHDELAQLMTESAGDSGEFTRLSKEYSDLSPIVEKIRELKEARVEKADLEELVASEEDAEMKALAQGELLVLNGRQPQLEREMQLMLLPRDEADARNAIIEVRAGTGGDEAGLFAAELFRLYQRYAERQGWKFEPIDINESGVGGYREGFAHRHLPGAGRRRPACQQDRQRRADYAYSVGHRRAVSGQQVPAQKPRPGDEGAARPHVRRRTVAPRRRARR